MRRKFLIAVLGAMICASAAQAEFHVLYTFRGGDDGGWPRSGHLVLDKGMIYGTTVTGGPTGLGTVFRLSKAGKLKTLHSFASEEGNAAEGGITEGPDGAFYGATIDGGTGCGVYGCGAIYKVDRDGNFAKIFGFSRAGRGRFPNSKLVADKLGNLYGSVPGGHHNLGLVIKITPEGKEKILHAFQGAGADCGHPAGGLARDEQGSLYGITYAGGIADRGCIFKVTRDRRESVLHSFTGGADGNSPQAGIALDTDGNLYGTAMFGGAHSVGTLFKLTPDGTFSVLHDFGGENDGKRPLASLFRGEDGALYGTTESGGTSDQGTVFKRAADGTYSVLYSFTGSADGYRPWGELVMDKNGTLYGTTERGGEDDPCNAFGCGVVYEITP